MIWAFAASLFGLGVLLRGEVRQKLAQRWVGKVVGSVGFFAVGWLAMAHSSFGYLMLCGLFFGVLGDIALLFTGATAFLAGLVAFLVGHLMYVIAFASATPLPTWVGWSALIPLAAAALAMRWLWPHLTAKHGAMRGPVIAYVTVITAMVIGALALYREGAIAHPARMLAGTVLFFASDLTVAREKFVESALVNRVIGLPAYYAGQLLIAWAISQ